jgi:hypothetical protein
MVTGYGLEGLDSVPGSERFFSSPQCPDRLWVPASLLSIGYQRLLRLEVKRQVREAGLSPPSSAEAKNRIMLN